MNYPYTQINRLDEPLSYMYTPFNGEEFLEAYRIDREVAIRRVAEAVKAGGGDTYEDATRVFLQRAGWDGALLSAPSKPPVVVVIEGVSATELSQFSIVDDIDSERLLVGLLAAQFGAAHDGLIKEWLDRFVQRFEVTKKIYITYPPGFRKGEGANNSVRLYWLLSLSLCLYFAQTRNLKYLNTLLKVNDLLTSLPQELMCGHFSAKLMTVVFQLELAAVAGLAFAGKGKYAAQ
jgi:hypothetical protein